MEEGDVASFFYIGLGLSLGGKIVSTDDRPSTFSIHSGFTQAGAKNYIAPRFARTSWSMSVELLAQKIEDLTCIHMFNIKQNTYKYSEKTGSCTKPKKFKGNKV